MRVVAIGGSASVGKTTAALAVAQLLGVADVVHVDDLSPAVQLSHPHPIEGAAAPWAQDSAALRFDLVAWTRHLHPAITAAAGSLGATGGVVEGEGVDPRISWGSGADVRPVYVIEPDRDRLRETFERRPSPRFQALTRPEQNGVVELNYRYGQWLGGAAAAAGQPWVPSQPWDTLAVRLLDAATGRGVGR